MDRSMYSASARSLPSSDSLADILERVLNTGVVVAGDIRVQIADIELLTIQIRLVICSVEKAQEIGLDWWKHAGFLNGQENQLLEAERARADLLEARLNRMEGLLEQALSVPHFSPAAEPPTGE